MAPTLTVPTIPAFRFGEHYDSLTRVDITTLDGSEVLASVGHVNAGVIRRDLRQVRSSFETLQQRSTHDMFAICANAAQHFLETTLTVSEGVMQTPEDYVRLLSATCGLPHALIHANMQKIADVMVQMPVILKGLTRGLDPAILETGLGEHLGIPLSYFPTTSHLGLVLPSNSPGVNSLWLPALALRIPVILKPGREDPWTPWRLINALLAAGCPAQAFGFYPTDHEGANVILSECERVILFGDARTVERHAGDPRISVHGPGYSKILIGDDRIERWEDALDVIADSVARNGGRSCVNASTVVVPRHGLALARALAERLARITPRPLDAPDAQLAGFVNANVPQALDQRITRALARGGAVDVSTEIRGVERCSELNGQTYLHPTVVYCEDPEHPLARTEFLFPFVSVVELPQARMLEWIGPSLVVTAITGNAAFRQALLRCAQIKRLNLGPMTTAQVRWDQPHEGNLFEFLYARRAIQEVKP